MEIVCLLNKVFPYLLVYDASLSSVYSFFFSLWQWSVSVDSDTLYSGLFEKFGILPDTALLLVCEDNISAVIEIGQYFYGVTLIEDFDCLM